MHLQSDLWNYCLPGIMPVCCFTVLGMVKEWFKTQFLAKQKIIFIYHYKEFDWNLATLLWFDKSSEKYMS